MTAIAEQRDTTWPIDLDDAILRFEDEDAPAVAALREVRSLTAHAHDREREAFVIFMAHAVWEELELSCEAAFIEIFGRSRRTLARWKDQLGFTDWDRATAIRSGLRAKRERDRDEPWAPGEQLALPFLARIEADAERIKREVERLHREQYARLGKAERKAVSRALHTWFHDITAAWDAAT